MIKTKMWDNMNLITLNGITLLIHVFYSTYSFFISWLIVFQTIVLILGLLIHKKIKYIFMLSMVIIFAFIAVLINGGGYGSLLVIVNTSLMLHLSMSVTISIRTRRLTTISYILLTVIWMFKQGVGLYNPNTVGIIAVLGVIFMDWALSDFKIPKLIKVILFSIFMLLVFHMIFEKSNSRNSIAAIAVYIFVVNLMPNKLLIKNLINKSIFLFLTVGSLVWTKIVIYLYQHLILIKLFFSNKHFYTGREIIWDEVWDLLKSSWLFGLGTHQSLSSITTFNLHNSMLNLLSAYGLLTAVAFIMLAYAVFKNMVNRLEKYNDRFSKISLAAYITIMFHAFNELTLFSTTFLAPMLALFSFLADYGDDLKAIKQIKCCNIATYKLLLKPDASVKKKYKQGLENYT